MEGQMEQEVDRLKKQVDLLNDMRTEKNLKIAVLNVALQNLLNACVSDCGLLRVPSVAAEREARAVLLPL